MPANVLRFALLILGAAILFVLFVVTFTVHETQQAIVLRFGDPIRVEEEAGLKFKLPIDNVAYVDKRNLEFNLEETEIIAANQERLEVDAFARYKIINSLRYYQSFNQGAGGERLVRQEGQRRLSGVMENALRRVLGEVSVEDIVTNQRAELMERIRAVMAEEAAKFGVEIVDVKIRRADLPQQNAEAVFRRMRTAREQLAQQIRAQGDEAAREIRAQADRQVVEIRAEAEEAAERLRGEGDAERNGIFAEAYSRDREFFAFYRSLVAYERALGSAQTGGQATIVLSPQTEFFRYFESLDGPEGSRR